MATRDEARFVDLYDRYRKNVQAYCARRARSDVQDLVAEVFLVAWRRIDQVPEGSGGLLWLYGVAYRVLNRRRRAYARRGRAVERLSVIVDVTDDALTDAVVVQRHQYQLVREAASRLRSIDQEILRLTLWEELPHAEVAKVLDINVDAAKQRAHRARRRLAHEYRKLTSRQANPPLLGKRVAE